MGVPVLTMAGYNFNSRCGESINKNLNMEQLIAKDEDDYVSKAVSLSNDRDKFLDLRKTIFLEAIPPFISDTTARMTYSPALLKVLDKVG